MKPDTSTRNNDNEYCRDLVNSTGMPRPKLCKDHLGIDPRSLRRYMSGERDFPYLLQFALESLVLEP